MAMRGAAHAIVFMVGLMMIATNGLAADRLIKLAHSNPNDPFSNAAGAMAAVFKSLVESGSTGAIRVDVYPEGQLGQDDAALALVSKGIIQSAISSVGGIAPIYPLIGALDIPFAFPTISDTYSVFDGPFGRRLAEDINRKTGLHVLGFGNSGGFFAITNSTRQIKSPDDVIGLKIRTMNVETHQMFVRSLGGEPVVLAWSEVYGALQSGLVNGQMNPIPIIRFARLDEVQKYLTLTNHFFTPYVWAMNNAFWDGLDPTEQAVIDNAARSAIVAGRGLSWIIESSDRGLAALKQRMDVYVPTTIESAAFRKASQPVIMGYVEKTLGHDGVELMDSLLAAIGKDSQH